MRPFGGVEDSAEARARARLLAHFEDNKNDVFYSRQLEILFENEYFHWITNRALRSLIGEGRVLTETRRLAIGSEVKLVWHKDFRFYKRAATKVFNVVDRYSSSASDGSLGLQGEHLVMAAFCRKKYVLEAEESNSYNGVTWNETGHDLDFIFSRDGSVYGIEVKNTLGYLGVEEFIAKIRMCVHLGIRPVFAVRSLPGTWIEALYRSGGYAMVMRYQFYPWTHEALAGEMRSVLGLPVDTPKRIEAGTMQRFENWAVKPPQFEGDDARVRRILDRINPKAKPVGGE